MTALPYPALWTPLDIGPMRAKHRVMITGHTLLYGRDGVLSDRHVAYYRERAAGGAAIIVTEQQAAHPSGVNYFAGCRAYVPESVAAFRKVADAVHPHGAKLVAQLFCGGAQGSGIMYIDEWRPLLAPTPVPSTQFHELPKRMTADDIADVIASFALSARNAVEGGCDGVEIHAAHSQLLGAFLSPALNHRDDGYGGDVTNRCRIVLEIGEAVRKALGTAAAVGLRLSVSEYLPRGAGITEADFEAQLATFAASGLFDFYDLSAGGYFAKHVSVTPMTSPHPQGFLGPVAKRARAIIGDRGRIFLVGRVLDLQVANDLVASDATDMVALTRAQMADPALVAKAQAGREAEIVRCVGANVCIRRLGEQNHVVCLMNPALGRESTMGAGTLEAAATPLDVTVVGAGPAGLRFAATAAQRGHRVTVHEQTSTPGGRLRWLAGLPHRGRWADAIGNLVRACERHGVQFRYGSAVTANTVRDATAGALVLATGAVWETRGYSAYRPERDGLPRAGGAPIVGLDTALDRTSADPAALGRHVVILDEGNDELVAGLAERLAQAGTTVEIISPWMLWGETLARTYDLTHLMPRLQALGVRVSAQHFVDRVDNAGVHAYSLWQPEALRVVPASTVVLAMARAPRADLHEAAAPPTNARLVGRPPALYRIGDCLAPRSVEAVIFEGEELARRI